MKILFATQNKAKLKEASDVLTPLGIEVENLPLPLYEPDAGTVGEVAKIKLEQAMEQGYDTVMVDDAGIYFAAYDRFPGVLTKRIFDRIGYKGIRKLLEGEVREAWFEGAVAVAWRGRVATFTGKTHGRISEQIDDRMTPEPGIPFDPIFIPEGDTRVLQAMPQPERLHYSYRRKALEKLADWLKKMG
ncbi:non-canonical purine NTP pyrophosphatase [Laceyella putida]|uniref:Non-canonical purine NTP pyrophosphatase n=1 Tax=Laceyella putida TaxID=110101 RepID=A0ABW2RG28_9BACL